MSVTISLADLPPLPRSTATSIYSRGSENVSTNEIVDETDAFDNDASLRATRGSSLPPVDRGFAAWSFLMGAFLVEAMVWSVPFAFGVFLETYTLDAKLATQPHARTLLPIIGNLSSGIIYCSGPLIYTVTARKPSIRRPMMWTGLGLCFTSLFGSSFADKVWELVLIQGALYGIGGAFLYSPCISFLSEWFVERRGLANGIIFAGTAIGGLILPLTLPYLLQRFGVPVTLRICAIGLLSILGPCLPFIRGRLPEVPVPRTRNVPNRRWMAHKSIWLSLLVNTIQGFAYFVPLTWLPTFATSLQSSRSKASLALALLNGCSVVSRVTMGFLSDRFSPWLLGLITLVLTSLATFLLWGFASSSLTGLIAYGVVYGSMAGGWTSLWTGFVKPITKDDTVLSTNLFGLMMLSRGLGNVLSTPISSLLSEGSPISSIPIGAGFALADGRYEKLILYVGTCFAGASVIAVLGLLNEKRR